MLSATTTAPTCCRPCACSASPRCWSASPCCSSPSSTCCSLSCRCCALFVESTSGNKRDRRHRRRRPTAFQNSVAIKNAMYRSLARESTLGFLRESDWPSPSLPPGPVRPREHCSCAGGHCISPKTDSMAGNWTANTDIGAHGRTAAVLYLYAIADRRRQKRRSIGANATNMDSKTQSTLRPVAFAAIVFSTVAITGCLVTFPLIFHYVQTLESSVQVELEFCKSRARDMWKEMLDIQTGGKHDTSKMARVVMAHREAHARVQKRDTMADFWARRLLDQELQQDDAKEERKEDLFVQAYGGCCTCQRGPPGAAGQPGRDGADGLDGQIGELGPPGEAAAPPAEPASLFPPQCPCEAPAGEPGPKGPPGPDGGPGDSGAPGEDGKPGDQGTRGPDGNKGAPGQPGRPGPLGEPGTTKAEAGPPGRPGTPGRPGPPGPPGAPGQPGKDGDGGTPGDSGTPGPPGPPGGNGQPGGPGEPGEPGPPGSCDHCPPARLAPGY